MRRAAATLALALCLLGCDSTVLGEPIPLLTGDPLGSRDGRSGCYTFGATGLLVVDPTHGTAIIVESWPYDHEKSASIPVMWRLDYTGRRSGPEVVVLDPAGSAVATTGNTYWLEGGFWYEDPEPFFACGAVRRQ